ncbi:MAG TPA: polyprenyl synthetase family protein [Jatrophihabitans sp.]|nr:polyprenyl synthetase family protein [Jatrophihabitans sp.]
MTTTLSPSLERSMDSFRSAMQAAVARMDPSSAAVSAYHLGWSAADGTPLQAPSGKGIRPALALLSAQAGGADAEAGVPAAVAVELVHNFSLLHDDVMDGDTERRHRPTVWTLWGVPSAILTGDAMLTVAVEALLESGSEHALAALRLLLATTRELIHGQVEDLQFESRESVDLQQCQQMAARKTGALIAASATLGCVLVGGDEDVVRALDSYGQALGVAFQLVDDLLGIWGDPAVTGKPVLSDLRARKRSLPVTYALSQDEPAGRRLSEWLAGSGEDEAGLRQIAELIEATGARSWAAGQAAWHIRQAEQALAASTIPPPLQAEFMKVARFVADREF